jgi:hypothetical protein
MKWSFVACGLLVLQVHGCGAQQQQQRPPIFRYISIAPCGRIDLGDQFEPGGRAVRENDSTFRLIPECFGDAEQILVHVTPQMRVTSFDFAYAAGDSLDVFLAEYRQTLGPPTAVDTSGSGVHTIEWRDAQTTFTFFRRRNGATVSIYSRLADRRR